MGGAGGGGEVEGPAVRVDVEQPCRRRWWPSGVGATWRQASPFVSIAPASPSWSWKSNSRWRRADSPDEVASLLQAGVIPVLVDPLAASTSVLRPAAIVDGRMRKAPSELLLDSAPLILGLGPGFEAGVDCHAVIETRRGHHLGRILWQGRASPDTKIPEAVEGYAVDRVLRAPRSGVMQGMAPIGSLVRQGDVLLAIDGQQIVAPFDGALRGLLHDGVRVERGMKVGDLDPRRETQFCREVSDKALAVGGAALEAILSQPELRRRLAE